MTVVSSFSSIFATNLVIIVMSESEWSFEGKKLVVFNLRLIKGEQFRYMFGGPIGHLLLVWRNRGIESG